MRKVVLLFCLIVTSILLAGCKLGTIVAESNNASNNSEVINVTVQPTSIPTGNEVNSKEVEPTKKPIKCELTDKSIYKVNIKEFVLYNPKGKLFKVKYAHISGLIDEKKENQINQVLKTTMTDWINKNCEWAKKFTVDVTYKSSRYLSLCYSTEWKNPNGEDLMSTFTRIGITVNMLTGERMYLDDFIKDSDSLKQTLEKYNYGNDFSPPIDNEEANKIVHVTSMSEKDYLEKIFKTFDPDIYEDMSSYSNLMPSFYLSNNQIVITRDEYKMDDIYINMSITE